MASSIRQPIPIKKKLQSRSFSFSPRQSSPLTSGSPGNLHTSGSALAERESLNDSPYDSDYTVLETDRISYYHLDYPKLEKDLGEFVSSDPRFSKTSVDDVDLQKFLPYELESLQDKARYLSHVVSHLYIAVKSMDLAGTLPITAKDLEIIKGALQSDSAIHLSAADSEQLDHPFFEDPDDSSDDEGSDGSDEDDEEADTGRSTPANKMSTTSAAIINARHWSIELRTLLAMNFPIPIALRASLAKVYYAICLSQGQNITSDIFLEVYQKLLDDKFGLQEYGLQLDWEIAYRICIRNFPHEDSLYDNYDKTQFKRLLNVCFISNTFFDGNAVATIVSKLLSHFSTANGSLTTSCLYGLLPMHFEPYQIEGEKIVFTENDVRRYIPSLFHIWSTVTRSENIDLHLVALLSRISEHTCLEASKPNGEKVAHLGNFGIFDETQFTTLMENLLPTFNIGVMKASRHPSHFYQSFSNLLVFSIVGGSKEAEERGALQVLAVAMNSLRSFVHPSNSGSWTPLLSKFVQSIITQYHKRCRLELDDPVNNIVTSDLKNLPEKYKLNDTTHVAIARILLPLIQSGLHSKKDNVVNQYVSSLSLLCHIKPEFVLDAVLVDSYSSLESITSSHRLRVVLKELVPVMRYMVSLPVYRVHVVRLLTEIIPGIDSNDLIKTIQTLHVIATTSTFIPFANLSGGSSSASEAYDFTQQHIQYLEERFYSTKVFKDDLTEFDYDEEYEHAAFVSSTSYFNEFLKAFSERLFILLENLPDPQKTHGLEAKIVQFLPKTFHVLIESLSDDCFDYLASLIYDFVTEKVLYTMADSVGNILSALVKRDPKKQFPKFLKYLISRISEEINENGAGTSRGEGDVLPRDQPLFWYTTLLSSILSHAGKTVVAHQTDLDNICELLSNSVKGPVSAIVSYIYYQILSTATVTRLQEARLVSSIEGDVEHCWGGNQFSSERFSEQNLTFQWHIPDSKEVQFAISNFDARTKKLMNDLEASMNLAKESSEEVTSDLEFSDKLSSDLLSLGYCIAGISHLFDPGYKESTKDASKPFTLKRKLNSLDFFRKKYGSSDTLSKSSPFSKSPENTFSPSFVQVENEAEQESNEAEKASQDDFVDANQGDEDVILEDDSADIAEIPYSTKATPSPSHGNKDDMNESLNAVLSFKNRKIYYSNYYFGEDRYQKEINSDYIKLHELRDSIGNFLHKVYKFLSGNQQNNTKLFKILLLTYKIWICDVGDETVLNLSSSSSVRFEYIDSVQYIRRLRQPYTRLGFGLLLEKLHNQRVRLFAGSRFLTPTDKLLLTDVVELSSSAYAGIAASSVSVLNSSMKLLLGSYSIALRQLLVILQSAIKAEDEKVIQHSIAVLASKRFKSKAATDFKNLSVIVRLLNECMLMETNVSVSVAASEAYSNIVNKLKIPSSVCDIRHDYLDSIRPPDSYVDFEIKAVGIAKEKKRVEILKTVDALTEQLLNLISPTKFWKVNYFNISLLINIQSTLNVEVHSRVLDKLVEFVSDPHPSVFRLCLKGICGVLSKVRTLSSFDYDLVAAVTQDRNPKLAYEVSTNPDVVNEESYGRAFKKEMKNFDNPSFFIDNKSNSNWLFWGDKMHVVDSKLVPDLPLHSKEKSALEQFGKNINKEWVLKIAHALVAEAESDGGYHTNDVRLISLLVHLSAAGFAPDFSESDWFEIIDEIYVPTDKDSHLVVCEIMAGLLVSNGHTTHSFAIARDEALSLRLQKILSKDLNVETRGIWVVFSWWVPGNADIRRFPLVAKILLDFGIDKQSDASFHESSRLMMLKHLAASLSYRFPITEELIDDCFSNLDHPYQAVREQISSLLTALFMIAPIEPYSNFESFVQSNEVSPVGNIYFKNSPLLHQKVIVLFENLKKMKANYADLSVQELLKTPYIYTARSILKFLRSVLLTSSSVGLTPYLTSYIFPFIIDLSEQREVCMLAGIAPQQILVMLAFTPFRKDQLDDVVDYIVSFDTKSTAWHNVQALGLFTQMFYANQHLTLSSEQRDKIFQFVFKLLFHPQLEVREIAAKLLKSIFHIWDPENVGQKVEDTIAQFTKILNKYKKVLSKNKSSEKALIKLHGSTLGLGAIVEAFPYISPIPRWIPLILTTLANKCSNIPGNVGKTAKDSLSKFKKNRQDTWHIDSKFFTQDELQDLEGVLWTSYFV